MPLLSVSGIGSYVSLSPKATLDFSNKTEFFHAPPADASNGFHAG
jgi:hypothetical protein